MSLMDFPSIKIGRICELAVEWIQMPDTERACVCDCMCVRQCEKVRGGREGVNFTKLFLPIKNLLMQSFRQKITNLIVPTFCIKLHRWNSPNMWCEIPQINALLFPNLFAQKSFLAFEWQKIGRKFWWNRPKEWEWKRVGTDRQECVPSLKMSDCFFQNYFLFYSQRFSNEVYIGRIFLAMLWNVTKKEYTLKVVFQAQGKKKHGYRIYSRISRIEKNINLKCPKFQIIL